MRPPRVALVGHCAAGKSTVVTLLVEQGIDAYAVAQEHSIVHDLWSHQQPNIVVFLDVSLEALRTRKANPDWPEWIYAEQNDRLAHARHHAHITIDTDDEPADLVVAEIMEFLNRTVRSWDGVRDDYHLFGRLL